MLFLIGWLALAGYLLNAGYEFLGHAVLWGGLALVVILFFSSGKEKSGNQAGGQTGRRNGSGRLTDNEEDELEEFLLYETLFDDED